MSKHAYVQQGNKPTDTQYKRLLNKLRAYPYKRNGIVPFPIVYGLSGSYLKFTKNATVELLSQLDKEGVVKIVPYWGIRILNTKQANGRSACHEASLKDVAEVEVEGAAV